MIPQLRPLGLISYDQALLIMAQTHAQVSQDPSHPGVLLALEHPPTITMGNRNNTQDMLVHENELKYLYGISFFKTDRGGSVTVHEPGQLVVYPILPLLRYKLSVKDYVRVLENAMIALCADFSVPACVDESYPGVWVMPSTATDRPRKIGAIGIRVENRVSRHGLALNVCNSLSTFRFVTPCGIADRGVTSLLKESGDLKLTVDGILAKFIKYLCEKLAAGIESKQV